MFNYLISISKTDDTVVGTVHDLKSKLKVKAFDVLNSAFIPSKGEVSFFVTAGKETIAFETRGYKKQREVLILQMISWYCNYMGLLGARIHSTWPQLSEAI